ncbi:PP2C-family Ser/Thr phosphatase [Luteitalea pratensis]|uniref:PP2C-family Ser/Thr phosphatase n=1 Tax=Luteitalea pratensis TaxID=1855912 RepID=A0A143PK14_LUTPR|nr:type VI secretion system-associated protein TagF [Luteitalea pratensis]AMY08109.1 PP2C-family Ser/Thr phosphatase [Luteitalea pratensis]
MAAIRLRLVKQLDVGFYGKLPTHGDFLRRRTSDAFVAGWDAWLQAGMTASQAALGDRWLDVYLTSPAWRFVCAAGACGPAPVAGVLVPSIDRVGRYFPLTVVAQLSPDIPIVTVATQAPAFFTAAERLLVDTLAVENVNFERFDARVADLRAELAHLGGAGTEVVLQPAAASLLLGGANWQLPIESTGDLWTVFGQLLSRQMEGAYQPLVMWWTEGSAMVDPSCLIGAGLPSPPTFGAFLDGTWAKHRWRAVPAHVTRPEPSVEESLLDLAAVRMRSAAATDVGRVRTINQDAFVERPELGLWVVADGLGGHRDGEIASREVCDALADLPPGSDLDHLVDAALERIKQVNDHLYRASSRSILTDRCGSTVVALLVRGTRCAVLWAGDSRVYRLRAGQLDRLTTDHSVEEADPVTGRQEAHAITRAVGVSAAVPVDVYRDELRAGDRFLLCSDGLTRIVTDAQVQEWLTKPDLRGIVTGLIGLALDGGGPDNVTAVIAEAYE